jgi:type I restriction enzyme M protein
MAKGNSQKKLYADDSVNLVWMSLAVRGIDANLGPHNADSFRQGLHDRSRHGGTDLVPVWKDLANPPFNMSDWGGENLRQDVRWKFGMSTPAGLN